MNRSYQISGAVRLPAAGIVLLALILSLMAGTVYAGGTETEPVLHDAYVYRIDQEQEHQLKYWLDLSGEELLLHCFFRSGDPEYHEEIYTLEPDSTAPGQRVLSIRSVKNGAGGDLSSAFPYFTLAFPGDYAVMTVIRDEKTLAGGADDNLLTGTYVMVSESASLPSGSGEKTPPAGRYADYAHFNGYSFHQEDGQLKYWIEFGDNMYLHCMFGIWPVETSGYYEQIFVLDPDFENSGAQELKIAAVEDESGKDVTDSFKKLVFSFSSEDTVLMEVERDESRLAGSAINNLMTGSYTLTPSAARNRIMEILFPQGSGVNPSADSSSDGSSASSSNVSSSDGSSASSSDGSSGSSNSDSSSFTPDQLCSMAQDYYNRQYDFYPPKAEYTENEDGTITIHLYEVVDDGNGYFHTATSAWYKVDSSGKGTNDITGEAVDLTK